MNRGRLAPLLWLALGGCIAVRPMLAELDDIDTVLQQTRELQGKACAPVELANAEADAHFARVELQLAHVRRASEHTIAARTWADEAYALSTDCGGADSDGDGLPDVVDQCPDKPEDLDGVADEDGCPDADPYGDDDNDGLRNIDDACPDEPEDFDGHNDGDGCPETSTDADGDGLIDDLDRCPDAAEDLDGYKDADGCPDLDNDYDAIEDTVDQCPNSPEDVDDFEDADGCPDPDNDGDGVLDVDDRCPNEPADGGSEDGCPAQDADGDGIFDKADRCPGQPETFNDHLDDDGCPDEAPTKIRVSEARIELNEKVQFRSGGDELLPSAHAILDEVLAVLTARPEISLRIEGHTDDAGSEAFNLDLSQRRADAVRAYLLAGGMAPDRLQAIGHGELRPIDTNRTEAGQANNRRVELHIVREEGEE